MALASSDGLNIDLKLEEAQEFLIIEVSDEELVRVEHMGIASLDSRYCGDYSFQEGLINLLRDCEVVFCKKAHVQLVPPLIDKGINIVETIGYIPQVIYKHLIQDVEKEFYNQLVKITKA